MLIPDGGGICVIEGVYVGACRLLSAGWGVGVLYLRRLANTHPYII